MQSVGRPPVCVRCGGGCVSAHQASDRRLKVELGYFLSSEEHGPRELVRQAQLAERVGMRSVWISDHYHPWLDEQGESPFVWSVIGAIAATTQLRVTTAVTCPTMRIHPAVIAHAAATSTVLLEGRFELGVGSGENLNEHIFGDAWPVTDQRLEMLEEAIDVIRQLWSGGEITHRGRHYTVENARLYTLPGAPPPIVMSGFGPKSTELAGRIADGYASTMPDAELLETYRSSGGRGEASAGLKVCWGDDRVKCAELATACGAPAQSLANCRKSSGRQPCSSRQHRRSPSTTLRRRSRAGPMSTPS